YVSDGLDPRWCRIDVSDRRALPSGETLRVEMMTDRAEYKPGDMVDVRLKVTDAAGNRVAAELSLGAVDASIYSLGEDRLPWLASIFNDAHAAERYFEKKWRSSIGKRPELPRGMGQGMGMMQPMMGMMMPGAM